MYRRALLKTAGLGLALAATRGWGRKIETAPDARPNIIFIIVDDMGRADLGCYGRKQIHTPNRDRMAAEGMRFTQAYSGCTVCAPARGNSGGIPLPARTVTQAGVLQQAGYVTRGFGQWGLGEIGTAGAPEKQDFDEFLGYYHQVHAHYYWTDDLWHHSEKVPIGGAEGSAERHSHHRIVERMKAFIRAPLIAHGPGRIEPGRTSDHPCYFPDMMPK
ncbi:MAG: sulfatase-like hydrolase/transferase [Planctomycetes bacterium]|nr:sulfatase-like hydrolase/transferase [Planctomycetota bacterium]